MSSFVCVHIRELGINICACMHKCVCVYAEVYVYPHMCVCVCVFVNVYICLYLYIYFNLYHFVLYCADKIYHMCMRVHNVSIYYISCTYKLYLVLVDKYIYL